MTTSQAANSAQRIVTPCDMLCLIVESDKINLPGYRSAGLISPWRQQLFRIVDADLPDGVLMTELQKQAKKNRTVALLAALFVTCGLVFAGCAYLKAMQKKQFPLAPIVWSVQSIKENGLEVSAGNARIAVPVGAKLPNGDVLVSVSKADNSFVTDKGTTKLAEGQK